MRGINMGANGTNNSADQGGAKLQKVMKEKMQPLLGALFSEL